MKKNVTLAIIFVIIVVIVLGAAVWYNNQQNSQSQQQLAAQATAAEQAQQQQIQQLMSELNIKDTVVGTGTVVAAGDTVNVLYTGKLDDGTVFDASSLHGNQPFSFTVGLGRVIEGWDIGLIGMRVGGTRELTIPPSLAYGTSSPQGSGIPANSTLHFTVQLLSIATSSGQ